jgi:hypothetical protein
MCPTSRIVLILLELIAANRVTAAPPKEKADAPEVVTGTVQTLNTAVDRYEDGRVVTKWTAVVTVAIVEHTTPDGGRVVKYGDTITIRWSILTAPGRSVGHRHDVHEGAIIRGWLARRCGGGDFYPIDNAQAIEQLAGPP